MSGILTRKPVRPFLCWDGAMLGGVFWLRTQYTGGYPPLQAFSCIFCKIILFLFLMLDYQWLRFYVFSCPLLCGVLEWRNCWMVMDLPEEIILEMWAFLVQNLGMAAAVLVLAGLLLFHFHANYNKTCNFHCHSHD